MSHLASSNHLWQYPGAQLISPGSLARLACIILPKRRPALCRAEPGAAVTTLLWCAVCSLDTMLGGGLKETTVTEIAGETCSGKTQVSAQACNATLCTCSTYWVGVKQRSCGSGQRLPPLQSCHLPGCYSV